MQLNATVKTAMDWSVRRDSSRAFRMLNMIRHGCQRRLSTGSDPKLDPPEAEQGKQMRVGMRLRRPRLTRGRSSCELQSFVYPSRSKEKKQRQRR
jgi:hypothetical protein